MATDPALDVSLRSLAIWALGRQKTDKARRPLIAALADADISLRGEAARSLGVLGARRAAGRLIQVMRSDPDASVRMFAAHALGGVCGPKSVSALREVLANQGEEAKVRGEAAEALGGCFASEAISDLIAALKDQSPEVRFWSAYALGHMKAESALAALESLASSDDAVVPGWWSVAREAADSIEIIRSDPWET
jgi:HEAT repeat protein